MSSIRSRKNRLDATKVFHSIYTRKFSMQIQNSAQFAPFLAWGFILLHLTTQIEKGQQIVLSNSIERLCRFVFRFRA